MGLEFELSRVFADRMLARFRADPYRRSELATALEHHAYVREILCAGFSVLDDIADAGMVREAVQQARIDNARQLKARLEEILWEPGDRK